MIKINICIQSPQAFTIAHHCKYPYRSPAPLLSTACFHINHSSIKQGLIVHSVLWLLTVIHSFLTFLQDEFMDVWVYVILKSRIPNLASTVAFLRCYSNPNLSFSEAGYYLASVEFACQFLRQLNEHDYINKSPLLKHNIVVCEPCRFGKMMTDELPMFDMVLQDVWLHGYELFAVKEWHLDPTRSDFLIFHAMFLIHLLH